MTFTIRRLPMDRCWVHGQDNAYSVDGTAKRACTSCVADNLRMAEAVLWPDREFHRNHDLKMPGCPFCYPGAVA